MKKKLVIMLMAVTALVAVGCGSSSEEKQEPEKKSQLDEDAAGLEEGYKEYVENMGIDVDGVLSEYGY